MIVLGWHGGIIREFEDAAPGWSTHDASATLLRDGDIICAIEEERLDRIKHSNFFPAHAIYNCLKLADISLNDVDVVAMNFEEHNREIFPCDAGLPSVNHFLENTSQHSFSVRDMICELFDKHFNVDVSKKLFFCNHHVAHQWSAFGTSGFTNSLIFSNDGSGDRLSGSVGIGNMEGVTILRKHSIQQSIGDFYRESIKILGYKRFDEYKAMGLAPYGEPSRFSKLFNKFFKLIQDGNYELLPREERWALLYDAGLVKKARRFNEPFQKVHMDFSAALQQALESIVFHILDHFRKTTGESNLCMAGGVAHNCTLNGKLLSSGMFDNIYVQPAAHDAGGSLGAAIAAFEYDGNLSSRKNMKHAFYGRSIGTHNEIQDKVSAWGVVVDIQKIEMPEVAAARLISEGKVIGWVQGRAEFGPRALGNRSIIADPRPEKNWRHINEIVKGRESFRPFAPSILEEKLFSVVSRTTSKADLSFMNFALQINDYYKPLLKAVTHINGSARVQSVSKSFNPLYWKLIKSFYEITGIPVVLNTSFNNNCEPIVDSIDDAMACFLTTGLDALIIGCNLVTKRDHMSHHELLSSLVIQIPPHKKLVKRYKKSFDNKISIEYNLESTASTALDKKYTTISYELFNVISNSAPQLCMADITKQNVTSANDNTAIINELLYLWKLRAIRLLPTFP